MEDISNIEKPKKEDVERWNEQLKYFDSVYPFLTEEFKISLRAIKLKSSVV